MEIAVNEGLRVLRRPHWTYTDLGASVMSLPFHERSLCWRLMLTPSVHQCIHRLNLTAVALCAVQLSSKVRCLRWDKIELY